MPNIPGLLLLRAFTQALSSARSGDLLHICLNISFSSHVESPAKLSHPHPRLWQSSLAQSLLPRATVEQLSPYVLIRGLYLSRPLTGG